MSSRRRRLRNVFACTPLNSLSSSRHGAIGGGLSEGLASAVGFSADLSAGLASGGGASGGLGSSARAGGDRAQPSQTTTMISKANRGARIGMLGSPNRIGA